MSSKENSPAIEQKTVTTAVDNAEASLPAIHDNKTNQQLRVWHLSGRERELIGIILAVKALLFLFASWAYQISNNQPFAGLMQRLKIWDRWDAPHYLDLARNGYQAADEERFRLVFYPLYPWLTRLFAVIVSDYFLSALLVSAVASLVAGVMLYRLARLDEKEITAQRAVVCLFLFPTSYFLHIGYTESLFIALVISTFYAARSGNWLAAGICGAFATLTRVNGLLLIPALMVEAVWQYRKERRINWQWGWIGLTMAGFLGYLGLNRQVTGNAFAFSSIMREKWGKYLTSPSHGLGELYQSMMWRAPWEQQMVGFQEILFIVLGVAATIVAFWKLRPSYGVWMALNLLLWTSTSSIQSTPRYLLALFPLFILFGRAVRRPLWQTLILFWSIFFLSFFAIRFVRGEWAF